MSHPSIDDLILRNERYAATHEPLDYISEFKASAHTFIISCADPRVFPEEILQMRPENNEAIVFRTIAGHPQPALQDLITLDAAFGVFKQIILIHHTDCGASHFTNEEMRSRLVARHPGHTEIDNWELRMIPGPIEGDLKKDLEWLKSHPLLPAELAQNTRGFMFDIKTGKLTEVK